MRKINNGQKFHNNSNNNNYNNTIYSLNYKFDSVCSAGKFSGTALDLIKKYNELAKEAHSNGNYVEMEVFRQYAEHYRKIVTEINERKNQNREVRQTNNAENKEQTSETSSEEVQAVNNGLVETEAAAPQIAENNQTDDTQTDTADQNKPARSKMRRRGFMVVEVPAAQNTLPEENSESDVQSAEIPSKTRRGRRPLLKKKTEAAEVASEASNA